MIEGQAILDHPRNNRNNESVTSIQYGHRRFLRAGAAHFLGLDHLREPGLFDDNGNAPLAIEVFDECTENGRRFVYWRAEALQDKLTRCMFGIAGVEELSRKFARLSQISRRDFIRDCAATAATLTPVPILGGWGKSSDSIAGTSGPARHSLSLDRDWFFGGKFDATALESGFNDSAFTRVVLPHCVTPLSWQNWDPVSWEDVWIYRRHFAMPPEFSGQRVFLHFDRIMAAANLVVNGHTLPQHSGGFLPFEREITSLIQERNVLAVAVDSRWESIPPAGSPKGPVSVDYMLPGGMNGSVNLRIVPQVFIRDVFAKPVNVLASDRRLEVICTVDAGVPLTRPSRVVACLRDGARVVARASKSVSLETAGEREVLLSLGDLGNIRLWDVSTPHLYSLVVTLFADDKPVHDYRIRVGFRDARFEVDGFFLNGHRFRIFGLNRHELYPYVGFAAPPRLLRRDAQILRHEFNCNMVRCSHYPQSEAFLDACDELGMMVWEEPPGWQYIGNETWQDLTVRDVKAMVRRDRNHPAIVIWGVRINESRNDPDFYKRTRDAANALDSSRPTSGTMTPSSLKTWREEWHQNVFAFDDYHAAPDGSVGIREPLPGVPYFITETVGQFNYERGRGFDSVYRRGGDLKLQQDQALFHAQAHDRGADYPRIGGVIAWCAFEYASLLHSYNGVKCPGVADVFRIPKLGASFYRTQVDPKIRSVIEPNFYWDFSSHSPSGPGERVAIFSNCDRLELSIDGRKHATVRPDRAGFPHLKYPPFFVNLIADGSGKPELRIDGYVGEKLALSRSFSSDRTSDRLWLQADDKELVGDGSDATRLAFGVVDKFGAPRPYAGGEVRMQISGPGTIVGDNPFQLADSGGAGAVWIRAAARGAGKIRVEAHHGELGTRSAEIQVRPAHDEVVPYKGEAVSP